MVGSQQGTYVGDGLGGDADYPAPINSQCTILHLCCEADFSNQSISVWLNNKVVGSRIYEASSNCAGPANNQGFLAMPDGRGVSGQRLQGGAETDAREGERSIVEVPVAGRILPTDRTVRHRPTHRFLAPEKFMIPVPESIILANSV